MKNREAVWSWKERNVNKGRKDGGQTKPVSVLSDLIGLER